MSKIRILPENLANQIAAGEVVERPASVVKELVENAIDAGATSLAVQVEGGGTSLIRVIDNGVGMDQDDILLSLERHATSKLTSVEQLDNIRTLGFRGEAVPSIASVARMTITSRQSSSGLGNRVEVRFGKILKVHEMGCQTGTIIEIRDLFGNVPARRKFLKTPRTELSHIEEVVRGYALVKPDLAVSYSVNGRELLSLPAAGSGGLEQRLKQLLRYDAGRQLVPVLSDDGGEVNISGFLLAPDHHPGPAARLRAFVNGRPVRDRLIHHAVIEGLRNYLMKGRQPGGVLFIDLPPAAVDVNVHPTKQEIRFLKSGVVHQLIVLAVSDAMRSFQNGLKDDVFGNPGTAQERPVDGHENTEVDSSYQSPSASAGLFSSPAAKKSGDFQGYSYDRIKKGRELSVSEPPVEINRQVEDAAGFMPGANEEEAGTTGASSSFSVGGLKIIGQLFETYILCQVDDGLVAIDQHAAQERLIFEKLKKEFAAGKVAGQALLFPETVELGSDEILVLENFATEISGMGLDIREFGGGTYVIKAVPAVMAHLSPVEVLSGLLDQFAGIGKGDRSESGRRLDNVLSVMACKAAVKANHPLTSGEMKALLDEMLKNDVFSHCPHGRPVLRKFSLAEIKKWFHRT